MIPHYFPFTSCFLFCQGVQRTTVWIRTQLKLARDAGYAGTWGPGYNAMSHVHVKDVASAILVILKAALEHKADEGAEGLCTYLCKWAEECWPQLLVCRLRRE